MLSYREGNAQTDDNTPRGAGVLDLTDTEVDDVRNEDTEGDHELVRSDDGTANFTGRSLRLEHGNTDTEVANTKTSDEATHHHVNPASHGSDLDDVSNDEDNNTEGQTPTATEPIRSATRHGQLQGLGKACPRIVRLCVRERGGWTLTRRR
jgi:hypothetical protein